MKVAIIGMGTVGQAQARWLSGHDLITFDVKDGKDYPAAGISGCDMAIITVGTPAARDGSADLTGLHDAMVDLPARVPVMLRSTVPPGTTDQLACQHPGPVVYVPEFLYENRYPGDAGRWHESAEVPWMLLGGTLTAQSYFRPLLEPVFPGEIWTCRAVVAELAKYTANLYWAARVTFVTELAAVAEAHGAGWDEVRAAWLRDPRVNPAHTEMAGHGPGFGGRCWPKDLSALIAAAGDAGFKAEFLASVRDANERHRSGRSWSV